MKKRTLLAVALLLFAAPRTFAAQALKVYELSGGALTVGGQPLKVGQKLPSGKTARLARGAKLVLDAGPWGKVLLHGPAVFTPGGGDDADGLTLKAGGALSVLHKVAGGRFVVRTPAVAAAVRGTTFYAEARGANASYVCICDGTIELESDSGAYKSTLTSQKKHRAVQLRFDNDQGLETEAPMVHHSDAEIAQLSVE